jgi:hypothetical protein
MLSLSIGGKDGPLQDIDPRIVEQTKRRDEDDHVRTQFPHKVYNLRWHQRLVG